MPDHRGDQPAPFVPVIGLDDRRVNAREQDLRLEADVHQRLCPGFPHEVDDLVHGIEAVFALGGEHVEILLEKQANQPGMQRTDLGGAARPDRVRRLPALSQARHLVDLKRAEAMDQIDFNGDGARGLSRRGCRPRGSDTRQKQQTHKCNGPMRHAALLLRSHNQGRASSGGNLGYPACRCLTTTGREPMNDAASAPLTCDAEKTVAAVVVAIDLP